MGALVQDLRMLASTSQLAGDGGLPVAEDLLGSGRVQPFSQREIRTMATCREGVFSRYSGVCCRAVNVAQQDWQRKV